MRREQVLLDLQDNLTPGLARAAVAARLLDRELKSMGGTSVKAGKELDRSAVGVDKLGTASRKSGPDIDKFSGRLRTLGDVALTLGPALIPIGAAAIPVLTAALVGLGAAAGGIGVTVLAFQGIGDGLKALDKAQLEPTAENLQALRVEMEKLGPAGADFVRFLDDLEPTLKDLQNVARAGVFPGVEDGIDAMLQNLPQVRRIVADLADGMGDLARDAGEALGGDKFSAFFDYLETDARPTLEAFAHSTGNVILGVSNMLVAFAPLSRDFTGGLEDATAAFAKWSEGLDDNDSFQSFLAYVRESGPAVVDLLGSLSSAVAGLIHAAAPMGKATVSALTAVAKAFAAIANSPVGPPLYTAAAALVLFNRAASLTGRATASMSGGFKKLTAETTSMKSNFSTLAGRGGLILAGAAAVGMLADSINRIDSSELERSLEALKFGDVTPTIDKVVDSIENLESGWNSIDLAKGIKFLTLGLSGDTSLEKMADNVDQVDQSLARLVESGNVDEAATLFQKISSLASAEGVDPGKTTAQFDAYAQALDNVRSASRGTSWASGALGGSFDELLGDLKAAKGGVEDLSGALSNLNGWFDRRQALRDYKDSLKDLTKGLKNGFTRADVENLDAAGRSILQVAEGIKDPKLKGDFLAGARSSLVELANNAGPKAEAAIRRVIAQMDRQQLTDPPPIPLAVDDKATPTLDEIGVHLRRTGEGATAKVSVEPGDSLGILGSIVRMLGNVVDTSATVRINTIRTTTGRNDIPLPGQSADGGTIPKSGRGYKDRYHYMLADGEEVISNRHGQADRHRSLLKAINAGRKMADGGTTGGAVPGGYGPNGYTPFLAINELGGAAHNAASGINILVPGFFTAARYLKALNVELKAQQKAYDKAKSARDDAASRRDAISGGIQSSLMGDSIWADIPAQGGVWASGSTPGGAATPASAIAALNARTDRANRFIAALNTLKGKGVTGAALQEILGEGLEAAEAMAASDIGTLSTFAGAVNESNAALAAAGLAGGNAVEGENVRSANKRLDRLHDDLQEVKRAIKAAEKAADKASDRNADRVGEHVNGAASRGHGRGR